VANLRRAIFMGSFLGLASIVVLGLLGHVFAGVFACVGLALGALNTWMVQRSVVTYANSDAGNKKMRFTRSVFGRLALITVLALGCALLLRPDGLGVFVGLAIFQMLMLGGSLVTTFRQLKQQR
jgi:hypothetical protein